MAECCEWVGEKYLGKKGTKRVMDHYYRNRIAKFLKEGKGESFICTSLGICKGCYIRYCNELLAENEIEYVLGLVIERRKTSSGREIVHSSIRGMKKNRKSVRKKIEYQEMEE